MAQSSQKTMQTEVSKGRGHNSDEGDLPQNAVNELKIQMQSSSERHKNYINRSKPHQSEEIFIEQEQN